MKSLFLIDGHNLLYRAFFGLPRLSAPDGTPTNAVLGTARVLLRILREDRPDGMAVVFDSRLPTPRHALFPEYKANRLKTPEDLSSQIPLVHEMVDALGIPRIEVPGVEADDVIGTLSRMAEEEGAEVVIVSSDKDLYQLVSPRVKIRDGLKERTVDESGVREEFGVPPGRVVDVLALAGDPSDNVPGVPGIGWKTAAGLIREFGGLEELLSGTGRLPGSRRRRIEEGAGAARLCRTLVTIDRRVSLGMSPADLGPRGLSAEKAAALFRRLGFKKLLEEILPEGEETPSLPARPVAWTRWEGEGLFPAGAGGVCREAAVAPGDAPGGPAALSTAAGEARVFPGERVPDVVRILGERRATLFVFDGKSFMRRLGAPFPAGGPPLFDVRVAGYLLSPDEGTPGLVTLCERYLPGPLPAGEGGAEETAASRAEAVFSLGRVLSEGLVRAGLEGIFREVDMPLLPVLVGMEDRGIGIDPGIFREISAELEGGIAGIEQKVASAAGPGFNINSPKQLAFLLFEKLGLPPVRRTKTGFSTDVEVLEQLKGLHEIPGLILEYRTLAKIRSTYVDVLPGMADPRDGRIHTTFHLTQTSTGRLSSSDPNLQNIPIRTDLGRRIRSGFVAAPGCLFAGADYSQVELRILAHLSGDRELARAFREGEDIHAATASGVFGIPPGDVSPELRRRAKVINFGIIYGMSPFGLSRELGIGAGEARRTIDQYFARYPGVKAYLEGVKEQARRDGSVRTILGRRRVLRDIDSRNKVLREAAERMAVNAPIQGSAADIIKIAMVRADRAFRERIPGAGLVLQVHDELIAEAPEGRAQEAGEILRESMEGAMELAVPLTVQVSLGGDWGKIH